jgi:hypothetical protein
MRGYFIILKSLLGTSVIHMFWQLQVSKCLILIKAIEKLELEIVTALQTARIDILAFIV